MTEGPISWLSKKQATVALSTSEAEYVSVSAATQEAVWLRRLLTDIQAIPEGPTVIMEDNQGAIGIAKNPIQHARTKHIDIRYHYVREALQQGIICHSYCPTDKQVADLLTKGKGLRCYARLWEWMPLKLINISDYNITCTLSGGVVI